MAWETRHGIFIRHRSRRENHERPNSRNPQTGREQKEMSMYLTNFIRERNEALISLDREKILIYCRKYGVRLSTKNEKIFWASVHKARLAVGEISETEKEISRKWLRANGFKT